MHDDAISCSHSRAGQYIVYHVPRLVAMQRPVLSNQPRDMYTVVKVRRFGGLSPLLPFEPLQ